MKRVPGWDAAYGEVMSLLAASRTMASKIWKLSRPLQYFGWLLMLAALAAAVWVCIHWADYPLLTPGRIGVAVLGIALTSVLGGHLVRVVRYKDTARQIMIGIGVGLLGWVAAAIQLFVFYPLYLRCGRLDRIEKLPAKSRDGEKAPATGMPKDRSISAV